MRESIFTSNRSTAFRTALLSLALAAGLIAVVPSNASAEEAKTDRTAQSEEDDFSSTPFTEYGEFNQENEEAEDNRFFQYGRFFGVSIGAGLHGVSGNRGLLWQGGFPSVDLKIHYWFDFNVAIDLFGFFANHSYDYDTEGHVKVSMLNFGADVKYYFDTKNLSAPISFANPYILIGAGSFSKSMSSEKTETPDAESAFGFAAGGGVEFAIKPKKIYFALEGKGYFINFQDTYTKRYTKLAGDMTGTFFSVMGSVLFTW